MQLSDDQLLWVHGLLQPLPTPSPDQDFTRILPRFLCLKIFSMLDPQSLCRAAQVESGGGVPGFLWPRYHTLPA